VHKYVCKIRRGFGQLPNSMPPGMRVKRELDIEMAVYLYTTYIYIYILHIYIYIHIRRNGRNRCSYIYIHIRRIGRNRCSIRLTVLFLDM